MFRVSIARTRRRVLAYARAIRDRGEGSRRARWLRWRWRRDREFGWMAEAVARISKLLSDGG